MTQWLLIARVLQYSYWDIIYKYVTPRNEQLEDPDRGQNMTLVPLEEEIITKQLG